MKRASAAAVLTAMLLSGCGNSDETYRPEGYFDDDEQTKSTYYAEISEPAEAYAPDPSSESTAQSVSAASVPDVTFPDGEIHRTFTSDSGKLSFTVYNVFSNGEYYTVAASATKTDSARNAVYIDGESYEEPELTLFKNGQQLDSVKPGIPDGDSVLVFESAADNYSYGIEIISSMREFGASEYPDVFGLVFRSGSDIAVPEYARYFAVFDGKLTELAIFENGSETGPRGARLEPVSAGVAKQFLTVPASNGGYKVIKYEYSFDLENRRLNRKQVKFYGWER